MKKEIKCFFMGAVAATVILSMSLTAFSESVTKTIEATYENIKIYVDGNLINPTDAAGNRVEPFTSNGTTYLPARAISNALGKDVSYDDKSNSVYIGKKPNDNSSSGNTSAVGIKEVTVGNVTDFIKELDSDKKIILKPGVYDLSEAYDVKSPVGNIVWKNKLEEKELNLNDIKNLTIEGESLGKVEIKTSSRYGNILSFTRCENINIKNIYAGHGTATQEYDAGVLNFVGCSIVSIENTELYGRGSVGISMDGSRKITCDNIKINHCSFKALTVNRSEDIKISDTTISDNEAYSDIISVENSKGVIFEDSTFMNNRNFQLSFASVSSADVQFDRCKITENAKAAVNSYGYEKVNMFKTINFYGKNHGVVTLKNSEIIGNTCDNITDREEQMIIENCKIENNYWNKYQKP